ncbi:hypothetical protein AMECASPLE_020578 [Ameca splendens]|uniref:Uncharacterized protein n=1 Tax=Ameca splendens TaxID=208324 RepID=A0ABV0YEF0_9TELE
MAICPPFTSPLLLSDVVVPRSSKAPSQIETVTLSLRHQVEQFSPSEGRTTGPHHHGYSCNVQFGWPTERAAPPNSYRG